MADDLKIRKIHAVAVPAALEKAEVYRLLNEPEQAESICLDILEIEPKHQKAIRLLILAWTDQFEYRAGRTRQARVKVQELANEYERLYYTGLVCEREARAHIARGLSAGFAHDLFVEALGWYAKAEGLAPQGNDDAILRRNSCLRTMAEEALEPLRDNSEPPLE